MYVAQTSLHHTVINTNIQAQSILCHVYEKFFVLKLFINIKIDKV